MGKDTSQLFQTAALDIIERFKPDAMLVGASCTAELIQDQSGSLACGMNLPIPVIPLELPSYSKKENWGAAETFYHVVRALLADQVPPPGTPRPARADGRRPRANLLGPTVLGFRCRDGFAPCRDGREQWGVVFGAVRLGHVASHDRPQQRRFGQA